MYNSILLPVDGSQLSLRAAQHGIELAKALNARVTVIMVTTPWATQYAREPAVVVPGVLVPETEYDLRTEQAACNCLRVVTDEARSAGVPSKALHVRHRDYDLFRRDERWARARTPCPMSSRAMTRSRPRSSGVVHLLDGVSDGVFTSAVRRQRRKSSPRWPRRGPA